MKLHEVIQKPWERDYYGSIPEGDERREYLRYIEDWFERPNRPTDGGRIKADVKENFPHLGERPVAAISGFILWHSAPNYPDVTHAEIIDFLETAGAFKE